ncbi:MAG: hypothetical protein HC853_01175, partial [Anaerolineae bacterium]|nr:hypothetical protein [Anaerolineae bacterium]
IGCVDNAAARKAICSAVAQINQHDMQAAWLDCGNRETDGQVVFGNAVALGDLQGAFKLRGRCTRLPVVFQLLPNLMTPLPEEQADHALSCEDLALANRQGLIVNQMVATIAGGYVNNLLSNRLRTFKTSFDLTTMTMHSLPINPVRVAREIAHAPGQPAYTPDIFIELRAKSAGPFVRIH